MLLWVILLNYTLGSFLLPRGDFSVLEHFDDMYHQCKLLEDPDMDYFDFFKDHIINLDGITDEHGPDDDQRPHKNHFFDQYLSQTVYYKPTFEFDFKNKFEWLEKANTPYQDDYQLRMSSDILKPPILS